MDFNATNSSYDLVPNPHYTGPAKPHLSDVSVETFTGITAQLNALKSGQLDIGVLDFSQIPQVPSLKTQGYSVFGYPSFGWFAAVYNFKDTTNHFNSIISQLYVRQALAELENQPAYVKGIFKNAAVASYGPVPPVPVTPFTPSDATHPPYSYNPHGAVALLKSHGWNVMPGGQTRCAKAGSGPGECGSGIPAGTPFTFTWFYPPASEAVVGPLESEAFASQAKQTAGINIQLQSKTFNFLISNYADSNPADAKYVNDWGVNDDGGISYDFYPTSAGIFNTGGGLNTGGYSDPTADSLINASTYGSDPNAVINEASYLTKSQPVLFFPNSDYIDAVSKRIGGPPDAFLALTELTAYLQSFYIKK
jgi:peptide/nickel transport system substrate-binding protein